MQVTKVIDENDSYPFSTPSSITISYPITQPSGITSPVVTVSGLKPGAIVRVYSDSNCQTLLGSAHVNTTSTTVNIFPLITNGIHNFYANQLSSSLEVSGCTPTPAQYTLDINTPATPAIDAYYSPTTNSDLDKTPTFTVSNLEVGAQVVICSSSPCSLSNFASTPVTVSGPWHNITTNYLSIGVHSLCAAQIDPSGNISNCSAFYPYTVLSTAPVAYNIYSSFFQDREEFIQLSYSDVEWDLATSCSVTELTNVTESTACSCSSGVCKVGITGTSTHLGSASFKYTVTTTDRISNSVNALLDLIPPFTSTWLTTVSNESITLPLRIGFSYNFQVDWGDGSAISMVTSYNDPDITHSYATAGEHTVIIFGTIEALYFNNAGDKDKLITVNDLGVVGWKNLERSFYGCSNLVSFFGGDTSAVTDMSYMFSDTASLKNIDLLSFDTRNVTDMSYMFNGASQLTAVNISTFDASAVTDMNSMFYGASSLAALDVNFLGFDTSAVTDMSNMFRETSGLISLPLSTSFNTSNVTNMSNMFRDSSSLTTLNLSNFDTAAVTNMSYMFLNTAALPTLNIPNFNTLNVTDMSYMFFNTSSLTTLDISNFNTAFVTDMSSMFAGCALYTLYLSNFNTSNVLSMSGMFTTMTNLTDLDISSFNTGKVEDMSYMFSDSIGLVNLDLTNFATPVVTNMSYMFKNTTDLVVLNTTGWDLSAIANYNNIFLDKNIALTIYCDQGGSPATGTFFGETCY